MADKGPLRAGSEARRLGSEEGQQGGTRSAPTGVPFTRLRRSETESRGHRRPDHWCEAAQAGLTSERSYSPRKRKSLRSDRVQRLRQQRPIQRPSWGFPPYPGPDRLPESGPKILNLGTIFGRQSPAPVFRRRDHGVELVQRRRGFPRARLKGAPVINFRSEGPPASTARR
jgi:hypothetical protein